MGRSVEEAPDLVGSAAGMAHAYKQLAEVLAAQQPLECADSVLDAFDDVLPILQLPRPDPAADVPQEVVLQVHMVVDDEPADPQTLDQDEPHQPGYLVGALRQRRHVVVGDPAADRHPREVVEERQHRIEHLATQPGVA